MSKIDRFNPKIEGFYPEKPEIRLKIQTGGKGNVELASGLDGVWNIRTRKKADILVGMDITPLGKFAASTWQGKESFPSMSIKSTNGLATFKSTKKHWRSTYQSIEGSEGILIVYAEPAGKINAVVARTRQNIINLRISTRSIPEEMRRTHVQS